METHQLVFDERLLVGRQILLADDAGFDVLILSFFPTCGIVVHVHPFR